MNSNFYPLDREMIQKFLKSFPEEGEEVFFDFF
jgi:hypothetical protein